MQPIYLLRNNESEGAVRVDRFPEAPLAVYTINIHSANFVGTVKVEGTIKLDPTDDDWFEVHTETFNYFTQNENTRRNRAVNAEGRFISMRASSTKALGWVYGNIDRVTVI